MAILFGTTFYIYISVFMFLDQDLLAFQKQKETESLTAAVSIIADSVPTEYTPHQQLSFIQSEIETHLSSHQSTVYDLNGDRLTTTESLPERLMKEESTLSTHPYVYIPVFVDNKRIGWHAITIDGNAHQALRSRFTDNILYGFLVTVVLILASFVCLRSVTRRNLQPLLTLTRQIGANQWEVPFQADLSGEFEEIGNSILNMRSNLSTAQQQRQLLHQRISHDILGPLRTVTLIADSNYHDAHQGADAQNDWQDVRVCSEQVTRLLEDLTYSVGEGITDYSTRTNISIQLDELIAEVVSYYRSRYSECSVQFICQQGELEAPLCTLMEPVRFRQIIGNLLDNAIAHGAASQIKVFLATDQTDMVIVEVANNGKPIPISVQDQIFEERFTTNASKHSINQGLGLPIVLDIVTGHGGKIELTSNDTSGVSFRVSLPKHDC